MRKVFFGDCRDTMRRLIADGVKVQACVTSPPYFGLRDYGHPGQLGLESTPEKYVSNMVDVFRLVRELLADDGVLWLNIGDNYNSGPSGGLGGSTLEGGQANQKQSNRGSGRRRIGKVDNLKHKDIIGIPWMMAFALRADGWYLRQDIIWHKPNTMPESIKDRCTKAHEYIFLLSKSGKYYFDADAIKEKTKNGLTRNKRSVWTISTKPFKGAHFAAFPADLIEPCILSSSKVGDIVIDPFIGSGTVAQVAEQHGRQWIGCELNKDYECLQRNRLGIFYGEAA
jgi:DNA modification methylase